MNKFFSIFFSMAFSSLLMVLFASVIGYATFIESDFGAAFARQSVYNAKWFEFLLILLSINMIGSIFKYKTWQNRKWSILIFHLAFIIIIIGAGITRYFGFEGMMHIREGESSHIITTENAILSVKNNNILVATSSIDQLTSSNKAKKIDAEIEGKPMEISIIDFIPAAAKMVNVDPNGKKTLWLAVADSSFKYTSIHLQEGELKKYGNVKYSFGENLTADIIFFVFNDSLFFKSQFMLFSSSMKDMKHNKIAPDSSCFMNDSSVYQLGWNSFVLKRYLPKGRIDVVSMVGHDGSYLLNALKLEVKYNGKTTKPWVFGSADLKGDLTEVKIDDLNLTISYGPEEIDLPFSIKLNNFILDRYENSMSPSSYKSNVVLIDTIAKTEKNFSIYMNNILKHKGYRFFQSSYDQDEKGTILSVNFDPIGTMITYLGYFLMTLGMFIALFSKKSYFRDLLKKGRKASLILAGLFLVTVSGFGQSIQTPKVNIDLDHAKKFDQLLVADPNGRIKPVSTLTSEILRKVSRKSSINGNNPTQILLSIMLEQAEWEPVSFIKITNSELRQKYGFKSEYIALSDVMFFDNGRVTYLLSKEVDEVYNKPQNTRTKYDKELLKLDERINLVDMIFSGSMLHIFPIKGDSSNKWLSPEDISIQMDDTKLQNKLIILFTDYYKGLKIGTTTGNWTEANNKLDAIIKYQRDNGGINLPSKTKVKTEILYNKINYFSYASKLYLGLGLLLLLLLFIKLLNNSAKVGTLINLSKIFIIILFAGHTATLGLRWYISGHAPWSNGYETTLFIAWATLLSGILFAKRSPISLALTSVLAAIFILISTLSWMDPEITNLVPVLKSYWLIVHVAVITSSYGFFAMGFLMGFLSLIVMAALNKTNNTKLEGLLNELSNIITMSLMIGLYLLTIGTFLGAVWANESWGRYWGWDPKETWALITVIVYSSILHLRHIPNMKNNFVISAGALIGFGSVLMTYFGVNYFLSGMHSYAGGDAFAIPFYAKLIVVLIIGFVILIGIKFYKNQNNTSIE